MALADNERNDLPAALTPADDDLVRAAQADPTAFVELYNRYIEAIYRYCWLRLRSDVAEDATSITFLNALRGLDSFDPKRGGFRAWLFRIAHNATVDQMRQRRHESLDDIELRPGAATLDDHVVAIDQKEGLERAVRTLSADQQTVIHLRLSGLKGFEIAEVLGKSPAAIRSIQHRAIERLRTVLGEDEQELRDE